MKKLFTAIILISFSILIIQCRNSVPPHPAIEVHDSEYCPAAQTNLIKLGCIDKSGIYTKKGKSFDQFCEETQNIGEVFINPKCLSEITSCDQIPSCNNPGVN